MKKRNVIILLVCLVIFIGGVFNFSILKNEKALFMIAEGLDKPSKLYNIVIKKIYVLSRNKNLSKKLTNYLEQNKNDHLHNLYIQVLGITGEKSSTGILIKIYTQYQHDMNHYSTMNRIIDAMGLIANDDVVPFLETLLIDHDKLRVKATQYSIARSLYLITGEKYHYIDDSGRNIELSITEELLEARNIILNAKGRSRTLQEMLLLDKLYRPPSEE